MGMARFFCREENGRFHVRMTERTPITANAMAGMVASFLSSAMAQMLPNAAAATILVVRRAAASITTRGASFLPFFRNQLNEDIMADQLSFKEYIDPFTGSKNPKA